MSQPETHTDDSYSAFTSCLPHADRESIKGLSTQELRAWALEKSGNYRQIADILLALHNAIAPIHCLPTELLSMILALSWDFESGRVAIRVGHVCRHWRAVLWQTPAFWAQAFEVEKFRPPIDDKRNIPQSYLAYITHVLQYSSPECIRFISRPCPGAISRLLSPHIWRIKYLRVGLRSSQEFKDLYNVLIQGSTHLTTLGIELKTTPSDVRTLDSLLPVTDSALPRLRELSISLPIVRLFAVGSIENARISTKSERFKSFVEFYEFVEKCSNIQHLILIRTLPRWQMPSGHLLANKSCRVVLPPSLKFLELHDSDKDIAHALPFLDIPSKARVYLKPMDVRQPPAPCLPEDSSGVLRNYYDAYVKHSSDANSDELVLSTEFNGRLTFPYSGDSARTLYAPILRMHANLTHLKLASLNTFGDDGSLLRSFPRLLNLCVYYIRDAPLLLRGLQTPDDPNAQEGAPVCPLLEVIQLCFVFDSDGPVARDLRKIWVTYDDDGEVQEDSEPPIGTIISYLQERTALIGAMLQHRNDMGFRLKSLAWWEKEEGMEKARLPGYTNGRLHPTSAFEGVVKDIPEFEDLVDGDATFQSLDFFAEHEA